MLLKLLGVLLIEWIIYLIIFIIGYYSITFTEDFNIQFYIPLFLSILTLLTLHISIILDNYNLKIVFKIAYSLSKLFFILLNAKTLSFTCISYYYLEIALSLYH